MFIIWGSKGNMLTIYNCGKQKCLHCNNEVDFFLILVYRYGHIFWLPLFVTTRQYYMICSICENGYPIDNKEIDKIIKPPIPWLHRHGWTIPIMIIGIYYCIVFTLNIFDYLLPY